MRVFSLTCFAMMTTVASQIAFADGFTYTTLYGPSVASASEVYGINNSGEIVDTYYEGIYQHGFTNRDGVFTTINVAGTLGTMATAINDLGQVVGTLQNYTDGNAFIDLNGTPTILNLFDSIATGINDSGEVVGWYEGNTKQQGFLYKDGIVTPILFPGSFGTVVAGINNDGEIVGTAFGNSTMHAFTYFNGVYSTLNVPGNQYEFPTGINDSAKSSAGSMSEATMSRKALWTTMASSATSTSLARPLLRLPALMTTGNSSAVTRSVRIHSKPLP